MLLALAAAAAFAAVARAGDEHHRRVAAELLVIGGDARGLAAGTLPPARREAARARIAGALSSLPLAIRRAGGDAAPVAALAAAARQGDWNAFVAATEALQRGYPHDLATIVSAERSAARLLVGESIHRESCAACHDAAQPDAGLAARNLYEQFASTPRDEFAARLLLGVRGDRSTAYRNPFSDLELGALMLWYESAGARPALPDRVSRSPR